MRPPFNEGDRVVFTGKGKSVVRDWKDTFLQNERGVVLLVWWNKSKKAYWVDCSFEKWGKSCCSADDLELDLLGTLGDIHAGHADPLRPD